jgi:hypothetical protein
MRKVSLSGTTIPHEITSRFSAAVVFLKPGLQELGLLPGAGSGLWSRPQVSGIS